MRALRILPTLIALITIAAAQNKPVTLEASANGRGVTTTTFDGMNKTAAPKLASQDTSVNPVPFVSLPLVPDVVPPGSAEFVLTVNGSMFVPGATVNWNGIALSTTFVSATQLTATVPAANVAAFGTARVTVSSPAPGGGVSNSVPFTIRYQSSSVKVRSSTVNVGVTPRSVVVTDFNNDGIPDLAIVNGSDPGCYANQNFSGTVSILLGNGDGTFSPKPKLCSPDLGGNIAPDGMFAATAADLNGDGIQDLMVTFNYPGQAQGTYYEVFLGNGDGTFTFAGYQGGWDSISPILTGDFGRRGQLELAMRIDTLGVAFVLVGGGGGYGPVALGSPIVIDDLNRDGILDFAGVGFGSNPRVFLGNGDGTFTPSAAQPSASGIVCADFNGDGIPDLTGLGRFLKGNGDGTFTDIGPGPDLVNQGDLPVPAVDVNGDGRLDIVAFDSNSNVLIYLGKGNGTFQAPLPIPVGQSISDVAVADFNGDGAMDLAVTNPAANTVTILLQVPATTTLLKSSANPSVFGQPVTFTATVVPQGNLAPTGAVTFFDGNTVLGTIALTNGVATVATSNFSPGQHPITAVYSGSVEYQPSMSSPLAQVVNQASTQCQINATLVLLKKQLEYKITSRVTPVAPGSGMPTGQVTFWDSAWSQIMLGHASLVDERASITVQLAPEPSPQWVKAVYAGDPNFKACESPYLAIFQ